MQTPKCMHTYVGMHAYAHAYMRAFTHKHRLTQTHMCMHARELGFGNLLCLRNMLQEGCIYVHIEGQSEGMSIMTKIVVGPEPQIKETFVLPLDHPR